MQVACQETFCNLVVESVFNLLMMDRSLQVSDVSFTDENVSRDLVSNIEILLQYLSFLCQYFVCILTCNEHVG